MSLLFTSLTISPVAPSFDLDHPLEVDDEYWETPDSAPTFKQPADKPAKVAFFNCYLKLNQILAFALRTIASAP